MKKQTRAGGKRVRYAVIGLGYFAQAAVLPAFRRAKNSQLVALFSRDPTKRKALAAKYDVPHALPYENYDSFLASGEVDAVYIVLPNSMHCDYTLRAAHAGVHVLCEKPMAVSEEECRRMIEACDAANVKLMIGYRLHFEEANLKAIEIAQSGRIGQARAFTSTFSMQVRDGNTRLAADLGGGPLYDIGIYCINAARYIFGAEPIEVSAFTGTRRDDQRFSEVEEHVSAILRFPGDRLACFAASFGAADVSRYEVIGTKGVLVVEPAYEMASALGHRLSVGGKTQKQAFKKRDQVAPELIYFSECITNERVPEPSGAEGFADIQVIRAIYASAEKGRPIAIDPVARHPRPTPAQAIHVQPHKMPALVHAEPPSN